ncbi:ABC transporter substrate-binding protein [Paenibacillus oenotherae]|uniref:ABC transporter substrate-binding protein n=1 Tax=Paenibacillus oenotherae TaxID=1435645 RepID=A0ABS7D290_9BACL|nr:ABC transporter substrate-binding protein [Paenibacillus oenotherae]MBW7474037.1 ABC transporter substrate-binding protein [Paenibacillus oenotherae]
MINRYIHLCCRCLVLMLLTFVAASCANTPSPEHAVAAKEKKKPSSAAKSHALPVYTEEQLAAYPDEISEIIRRGQLRIAVYREDRYPFFYSDEQGQLRGSDIDLARDIAYKLGVKAAFIRTADSFDRIVEQVAAGEADIAISKLSMTLERAKKVLFSEPYLTLRQTLIINRLQLAGLEQDDRDPLELIQTYGDRIGIIGGTSYASFASELFPDQQQVVFPTLDLLIEAVKSGEVLAAVYDEFELMGYQKKHPSSSLYLQYLRLENQTDSIAVAVAPGLRQLHSWMNVYMQLQRGYVNGLLRAYEIIAE